MPPSLPADSSVETVGSNLEEQQAAARRVGERVFPADYEPREEVGHGGMGVVFRARDTALDRDVAIKLLLPQFATASPVAARFLGEARIAAQLQHPGIPPVHAVGTLPDGRPFIAMKLIKGKTLKALLDEGLDRGRFLTVFEHVAQAVAYAHQRRVIHRDLKPGNIMVGAFGEVQVMDWGLAKVLPPPDETTDDRADPPEWGTFIVSPRGDSDGTEDGSVQGTPAFMPPEQAGGELHRIGPPADVFALGAVLCYGLIGRPAYTGRTAKEVYLKAVRAQTDEALTGLDACGADPELVTLARRCLAADPGDRPTDAGKVVEALAGWRAAADERARLAEHARAERAVAEAARDRATRLYLTALDAFNRTVFEVQERLEARAGTNELQRELFAAARAGLDRLLRDAPDTARDPGAIPAARLGAPPEGVAPARAAGREWTLGHELDEFGDQLLQLGLIDEARKAYAKSLALRQRATDAAPDHIEARRELLECYKRAAALELSAGDASSAREFGLRALETAAAHAGHPLFAGEVDVVRAILDLCAPVA